MTRDSRWGEKGLDEEVQKIVKEIERLRRESVTEGTTFEALDEDQIRKKILGETSESPYIYATSWRSSVLIGQSAYATAYVHNPDSFRYTLYLTLFFGLSGGGSQLTDGWDGRDTRWTSASDMFSIDVGGSLGRTVNYITPAVDRPGTYIANLVLWLPGYGSPNQFLDRRTLNVFVN